MTSLVEPRRNGGRTGRLAARESSTSRAVWPGLEGGSYRPLSDSDVHRIHQSVLEVLSTIGMADATPDLVAIACERGCSVTEGGRLVFPASIVEDILGSARREFTMYSRDGKNNVSVGGRRVYFATSGEAISIVDSKTGTYRPSTLLDIYDCARLCDTLDNIHQVGQPCVATDIVAPLERDVSIAYALAAGTLKTSGISISSAENLTAVIALYDIILGGEGRFVERPFCSIGGCCPVVSPLRFAKDSLEVLMETSRLG